MTPSAPILVVAPLREELAGLLARLEGPRPETLGGNAVQRGMLVGRDVVAAVVGDGHTRSRRAVRALLEAVRPSALLGIGVAGGLDPGVRWGEALASRAVRGADGEAPPPDAAWRAGAAGAGIRVVPFAVAPRIVGTPEAKADLRRRLGGDVVCVDLESAVFAEEAARAGVPYLVLRSVVDEAGDEVAPSILAAQDADGHVGRAQVAFRAMLRPAEIRRLKQVQARVETCSIRLADAVESLLGAYDSQARTASSGV